MAKKLPDGITYTALEKGRCLVWDATCADYLAASNMIGSVKQPGMASEKAEARKQTHHFIAFAVGSLGPKEAVNLINKIGSKLIQITGEPKIETLPDRENIACHTAR